MFVLNRVVDAVFLLDVAVQCNTAFFDDQTNALNTSRSDIARRYLRGGAAPVDLIALLPLDLIPQPGRSSFAVVVIRVLRLLKLGRIRRLPFLSLLLLDRLRARSGHLRLASFLLLTCLLSHVMACGLHLVASFQSGQGTCTWVDFYFHLLRGQQSSDGYDGLHCGPLDPPPSLSTLYLTALVWSMETMTTVGYGDVIAVTNAEHAYIVCAMLVGGAFYSYVVGTFVSVVAELSHRQRIADRTMDTLNEFLSTARVEATLAARLRRYVRSQLAAQAAHPGAELHELLDGMSPLLRHEVALSTNAAFYARLPLLSTAPLLLLIELSFAFKPISFPPGEELCRSGGDARRGLLICLRRGLVRVVDPLLEREGAQGLPLGLFVSPALTPAAAADLLLGEESLWAAAFPGSPGMALLGTSVTSVTTASCMTLRAAELAHLLLQFPEQAGHMRVPVRARWLRRRLRLVVEGARRVRTMLATTRRIRSHDNGASFSDLVSAAAGSVALLGSHGEQPRRVRTQIALLSRRFEDPSGSAAESAPMLSLQLAVFVVSFAAPARFQALVAAALTIQKIFRGSVARERLRQRLARARHSTRAMQRLASKLAGKEPAVVALEMLRAMHKQLQNTLEQQEQVVSESMERSAVARERMRLSQLGLPKIRRTESAPHSDTGTS